MCINLLLHSVIPDANVCVSQQILEGVAAFDTFQNTVNSEIRQIGLAAAHKRGTMRLDGTQPVISLVVQRLSHVVFQTVPLLQPLPYQPHCHRTHVHY